tara:strand:- start:3536 stop:3793 length:258 start_codon:yes stop_codon:yes gene_type:complete
MGVPLAEITAIASPGLITNVSGALTSICTPAATVAVGVAPWPAIAATYTKPVEEMRTNVTLSGQTADLVAPVAVPAVMFKLELIL